MSEEAEPTYEEIARRAHEISLRDDAGADAQANWYRAEEELRAERAGGRPDARTAQPGGANVPEAD